MSRKRLSHEDYIVGWICPLEVEQIAALEMLDEEHERLPQSPTDHNVYTLGSITGHNIVIAGLHKPGNNPAATVVTQMRMTFPNLRFGMLVGIGGGVPVITDNGMIRLGDVVVSKPSGVHSGAVQYDHGKAEVGQFRRTGALAPPPAVLLNAAQDLAAKRARSRRDPVAENIQRIDTSIRGLRRYKHPGPANDHLYQPNYDDEDEDNPYVVVHRGTIASGGMVIKDGMKRDQLAQECGVLCFEMEAAGALAGFPCIVIRGISDYCDSHKNDHWHGYAAAAAAAYARQLFFHMPIDEVKRCVWHQRFCAARLILLSYISPTIENKVNKLVQQQDDQKRQEILNWLTPVNCAMQQSDFLNRRQKGTGQWLLDTEQFQQWVRNEKRTLFCSGIPGAGKTILTSIIIDHLERKFRNDSSIGIAYFYCNFRQQHEQTPLLLLSTLLKQLAQGRAFVPESVKALYEHHKQKEKRPGLDEISGTLLSVITEYTRTFFVIDALDECPVSDGARQKFLNEIFGLQNKTDMGLLVTSRPNQGIEQQFDCSTLLEIQASNEDIQRYLDGHMFEVPQFVSSKPDLQKDIKAAILKAVKGM
jgi:nucleoside phosphorylase